jgi:hypothetical protein
MITESATDVRLDGDEMTADADDGDAGHFSAAYMILSIPSQRRSRRYPMRTARTARATTPQTASVRAQSTSIQ